MHIQVFVDAYIIKLIVYRERERHTHIYIYIYIERERGRVLGALPHDGDEVPLGLPAALLLHPVSITRFPLTRFSPGSGLLRNPLFHR